MLKKIVHLMACLEKSSICLCYFQIFEDLAFFGTSHGQIWPFYIFWPGYPGTNLIKFKKLPTHPTIEFLVDDSH